MSDTASARAERWLFGAWAAFSAVNVALMFLLPGSETVPFHFVWISLSLVYGVQPWTSARTALVLLIVCVSTGFALVLNVRHHFIGWEETTEVPLMTLVFLAMVLHVRLRVAAVNEAHRLAASERDMRDAQRRFVRRASHELRTPLTIARGFAELISTADDLEQAREDARIVLDELAKLERNGERLLALTGLDERAMLNVQQVDLDELLSRTAARWRGVADRRWSLRSRAGTLTVDPERVTAALDCLLENALRYTDENDRIAIEAHRDTDTVAVAVYDTGCGIPADQLPHIFDAFHAGSRGGTGIGLAIVKAVVEAHGGTVQATSVEGVGSTFNIVLPIVGPMSGSTVGAHAQAAHNDATDQPQRNPKG